MTDGLITVVEVEAYDPSRSNLLPYPRALDNAAWTLGNATISANAGTAADNRVLADKLVENTANSTHFVAVASIATASNVPMVLSVWAKAAGRTELRVALSAGANVARTIVDLNTGACTNAVAGTGVVLSANAIPFGLGWWRVVLVAIPEATNGGSVTAAFQLVASGAQTYTGDGISGVLLDRGLLEVGSVLGEWIDNTAAGPGLRRYYWSTAAFVTGASSTPPHQAFDPRIVSAPSFTRRAFSDPRAATGAAASGGVLELANGDHALAPLLDMGIAGRAITVRVGPAGAVYPGGFTTWLTGTVESVEVGATRALLRIRDRLAILDQPLQATKYAGNNSLPNGAEGVATDIGGQPKPKAWGKVLQVPLVLVNTALLIYQGSDGPVQAFDAVYDKGVALTASGTDHANLAALSAATIAAGQYDTCKALGLVRLGGSADGKVTADLRGDAAGSYVDRVGAICRRILETVCGVPTAEIDTASFAALDAAANFEAGIWIGAEATRREVLAALAMSVGAWVVPSAMGVWKAGQIAVPTGSAVLTLTDAEIIDIDRVPPAGDEAGIPVWEVTVRYGRYWAGFSASDLAAPPGITEARRGELQQEWRTTTTTDATTRTAHPLAVTLQRDTCLASAADAATERDRLLALHKVRRDMTRCRVPLIDATAALDVGSRVDVVTSALGYGGGRSFLVAGITREGATLDLALWG